ncbi:MAG: serine/threonine-protein kinase, partial [Myxococcota bacterium]
MDAKQYQQAYAIFMDIVDLSEDARERALSNACGDDMAMRAWVQELLADDAAEQSISVFDDVVTDLIHDAFDEREQIAWSQPGYTIAGRYEVIEALGRGGMASVWKVRHQRLDTLYALKVLHRTDQQLQQRLRREGIFQAGIQHPNVVTVFDLLDIDGQPGLLMEYIPGPDLRTYLRRFAPSPRQMDALTVGILDGMQAVHDLGVVHRDVKPANILLAPQDDTLIPKVTDFGIARRAGLASGPGLTRPGALMGTLGYMSPEQIRDPRSVDHRADIWAMGCLLYRMVAGRDAFDGKDTGDILQKILAGEYLRLPASVPDRWRAAIEAALTVNVDDRPIDCNALADIWNASHTVLKQPDLFKKRVLRVEPAVTDARPARPPTTVAHNLPVSRDRFFGRTDAIDRLQKYFTEGDRFVNLLGTGGLGKSRLAIEVGRAMRSAWPGGVWWVPLSTARSLGDIWSATASALNRHEPALRSASMSWVSGSVLSCRLR